MPNPLVVAMPRSESTPSIEISMDGDLIVLRPNGQLDLETTYSLVSAVDAGADADASVLIDLDGSGARPAADHGLRLVGEATATQPTIDVVAAGVVRLSSPHSHWMIDLGEARFCRSATPISRRFVAPDEWTGIRTIWATREGVSILTDTDAIISTSTRWIAAA